ncbi:hypothetical protein EVAR_43944_1 [Eumeta japonica]|uniref:Uncharacterized protein n=1 Tax=Eumeta variegata TaxID=151549 RepID=A0A4C1XZP9_EUMVA|nr:hypothetical protein EVAR_43944_1 [Eumeta japonica]
MDRHYRRALSADVAAGDARTLPKTDDNPRKTPAGEWIRGSTRLKLALFLFHDLSHKPWKFPSNFCKKKIKDVHVPPLSPVPKSSYVLDGQPPRVTGNRIRLYRESEVVLRAKSGPGEGGRDVSSTDKDRAIRAPYLDQDKKPRGDRRAGASYDQKQTAGQCCARGRPIIVEWERDARHSAGLSRSVTHRYVTERYTFQSDSQPQPNLRRCHVKIESNEIAKPVVSSETSILLRIKIWVRLFARRAGAGAAASRIRNPPPYTCLSYRID